jgi:6-pyruvoyl-tetrahydropterin synthase
VYRIWRSVDVHFGHQVRGHRGSCINIHGHTWKLEVCCAAETLDKEGFVIDFRRISTGVLQPAHALLDHSLAIGAATWGEVEHELAALGNKLVASRVAVHGADAPPLTAEPHEVHGAHARYPGGMKVAVFPFSPSSETLAKWLWELANAQLADARVSIPWVRVYETLHPVESVAEFSAPPRLPPSSSALT